MVDNKLKTIRRYLKTFFLKLKPLNFRANKGSSATKRNEKINVIEIRKNLLDVN